MKPFPLALVAALLCACRREPVPTPVSIGIVQTDGGMKLVESGVEIVIVDVRYRAMDTWIDGKSESSRTVLGHPFGLRDGVFFIGPTQYGPARAGARIRVAQAGVTIDGEPRGPLPPAIVEEEEQP